MKAKHLNLGNARVPKQINKMKELQKSGICPFCNKYFKQYHDNPIIRESEYWITTKNDYPYDGSKIHILLVHKKHIDSIDKVSDLGILDLLKEIKWLKKKYRIQGGSLLLRFGDNNYTGATVTHLHLHIISGKKKGDSSKPIMGVLGWQ